jgi:hypothetical protein
MRSSGSIAEEAGFAKCYFRRDCSIVTGCTDIRIENRYPSRQRHIDDNLRPASTNNGRDVTVAQYRGDMIVADETCGGRDADGDRYQSGNYKPC